MTAPPRILAIAGSDSSGGAGIQADIKTITMLGGYAMTAITAVTAQNTIGVTAVETLLPEIVGAQIDACLSDIGADAVKIGMLGSAEIAIVVAERLQDLSVPIVFDPVIVATSGAVLADEAAIIAFERLMDIATLVTPNLPELEALSAIRTDVPQAVNAGALSLADDHQIAVLAKGGHGGGDIIRDVFVTPGGRQYFEWETARIETRHTHGTGCTLSSAIATLLGKGLPLEQAIAEAREFVRKALLAAPGFGSGHGPLGHHAVR
jgi:hydroxymethylpyrimidine/phosphomethylpyrimidine kinase